MTSLELCARNLSAARREAENALYAAERVSHPLGVALVEELQDAVLKFESAQDVLRCIGEEASKEAQKGG